MTSPPPDSEIPMLRETLARLDAWLARHRRRYFTGLQPPASDADLHALQASLRQPIPEGLRELLCWHNGQGADHVGYFENRWILMRSTMIAEAKQGLDEEANATGWRPAWIPFLDNEQGDYLCVDTSQSPPRVRHFLLGQPHHAVVASSLSEWLTTFVDRLERGCYVEDPERGEMIRAEDDNE